MTDIKEKKFTPETEILHCHINPADAHAIVTPLFQNSAFSADSPYFYTRKNNPNYEELEKVFTTLEEAEYAISVTTGMTAVSMSAKLLDIGDHLVLNKDIYGCTYKFFQRFAKKHQVQLTILDLSHPPEIEKLPGDVKMVFFETPTNPYLKTVNISAVVQKAKRLNSDALIVVDNTWATPLFQRPLEHGADLSVYSLTKFASGHSDVMGGMMVTNRSDVDETLRAERFYTGSILAPHSAWLLRRSMYTFTLRMREHSRIAREMLSFLDKQPQVLNVYYPEIDGTQLSDYGCILFFDLRQDLTDRYREFSRALELFDTGTGMACVTSMVAQPYTGSHASMNDREKKEMGLEKNLVRLCFGMEEVEDLKKDLLQAFAKIDP